MKGKYEIDMLNGPVLPKLVTFFLPLMLSGILQLLFNAVDLVVVGRFTGSDALAAVGATGALSNLLVNLFMGLSIGANVVTAAYIARGEAERTSRAVHTAITAALVFGFVMIFVGLAVAEPALRLMATPESIIGMAATYMRIYFCGMPFLMLYNFGAAILRAAGDTRRPMYYLVIAGVLNAILNLILVIVFRLGVVGVAVATVFSQMVSSMLVLRCLMTSTAMYRVNLRKLGIDGKTLKKICSIGIPAGLQGCLISFSNALLQSSVNSLGENAMAGYTATGNVMGFLYVSVNAVTQGCMTFTSQNMAAHKAQRMKRVLVTSLGLEAAVAGTLGLMVFLFGNSILSVYNSDAGALAYGMEIVPECFLLYFICGFMDCMTGTLRGMGKSTVPMLLSLIGTVGTRVAWITCFFPLKRTMQHLFVCYPASWTVTFLLQLCCYAVAAKKIFARMEEGERLPG